MAAVSLTASVSGIPQDVWLNVVRVVTKDCADDAREALERVQPSLLPIAWTWNRFDQEHDTYQVGGEFPFAWSDFENLAAPSREAMDEAKQLLCGLSPAAVALLLAFGCLTANVEPRVVWATEAQERLHLTDSALYPLVKELGNHNMAFTASYEDILSQMKVEELKITATQLGIEQVPKGKAKIVNRILQIENREAIRKAIPADRLSPSFKLRVTASEAVAAAVEWERSKIELLCHTLSFEMTADRDIRGSQSSGLRLAVILGDSECDVCRQHNGKRKTLASRDTLPPYHIGCRCTILPCDKELLGSSSISTSRKQQSDPNGLKSLAKIWKSATK